jgi:hypothetical protein
MDIANIHMFAYMDVEQKFAHPLKNLNEALSIWCLRAERMHHLDAESELATSDRGTCCGRRRWLPRKRGTRSL